MEKIYNKLKRLKVEELKEELEDLGVPHSRCKSKDDLIRAFLQKKASSAKLTPKKIGRSRSRGRTRSPSLSSRRSECIIESMQDSDVKKVDAYLKKRMAKQ